MNTKMRIEDVGKTLLYNNEKLYCTDYNYTNNGNKRYYTFIKPDGTFITISYRHVLRLTKSKKAIFLREKTK